MGVSQRVDRRDGGAIERSRDRRGRVAADVVEALVARRRRDQQRDRVGAAHDDGISGRGSGAAARQHANAPFETQRAGHRLSVRGRAAAVAVHAAHHEIAVRRRLDGGALRRRQPRLERDPAGTARREVDDDHAIRRAGEHLPRERRLPCRVRHVRRRRGKVQIAAISLDRIDRVERQVQVAERLVRHLRERLRHHALAGQCRRIGVATLAQQATHVRDRGLGVGIDRVVGTAGPQRRLVELQALVGHPAEDHRSETPVADGQRTHPLRARRAARQRRRRRAIGGGLAVPQAERRVGWRRFADEARSGCLCEWRGAEQAEARRDQRDDGGTPPQRTSPSAVTRAVNPLTGRPSSSMNRAQKSVAPPPLTIAARMTFAPFFNVSRFETPSSMTAWRSL